MPEPSAPQIRSLFHATRLSWLPSIMENGLLSSFHGRVHGEMDYAPPERAVYLSRHENSNNLNAKLFDEREPGDQVVVLEIDAMALDVEKYFPDDAFFHMLDCDFNIEEADCSVAAFVEENRADFAARFGLDGEKAERLLGQFCSSDGDMESYAPIARQMAREYLAAQGEIAYLGDVPASAILGWKTHPKSSPGSPAEKPPRGHTPVGMG